MKISEKEPGAAEWWALSDYKKMSGKDRRWKWVSVIESSTAQFTCQNWTFCTIRDMGEFKMMMMMIIKEKGKKGNNL